MEGVSWHYEVRDDPQLEQPRPPQFAHVEAACGVSAGQAKGNSQQQVYTPFVDLCVGDQKSPS